MILKDLPKGMDFFVAVVCVCFMRDGRIVILQKRTDNPVYAGLWGFPAGKLNGNDNCIEAALQREVCEETGNWIKIKFFMPFTIEPTVHYEPDGKPFYFYSNIFYLPKNFGLERIKINKDEHRDYKILEAKEILEMPEEIFIPDALNSFKKLYRAIN